MNKEIKLEEIILKKNWKLMMQYFLPVNIADALSFIQAMHVVGKLLIASAEEIECDPMIADKMRDFSMNLMIILRSKHPQDWKNDWKNEAFLGIICAMNYREEEGCAYLKNAYHSLRDPPQSLLLAYFRAGSYPETQLAKEEVHALSKQIITKGITYESACLMAENAEDQESSKFWKEKAFDAEAAQIHSPIITPNVLKEIFPLQNGYINEK
jgi:hypothetical protein